MNGRELESKLHYNGIGEMYWSEILKVTNIVED